MKLWREVIFGVQVVVGAILAFLLLAAVVATAVFWALPDEPPPCATVAETPKPG